MLSFKLLVISMLIMKTHCCLRSSLYYQTTIRVGNHIFSPGEYQPRVLEHTLPASGEYSEINYVTDALNLENYTANNFPEASKVFYEDASSTHMSKNCRLAVGLLTRQIERRWPDGNIRLLILRAWIKPPDGYEKPKSEYDINADSLYYTSIKEQEQPHHLLQYTSSGAKRGAINGTTGHSVHGGFDRSFLAPIVDMTPEMMVDDDRQKKLETKIVKSGAPDWGSPLTNSRRVPRPHLESYRTPWQSMRLSAQPYIVDSHKGYRRRNISSPNFNNIYTSKIIKRKIRLPRKTILKQINDSERESKTQSSVRRLNKRSTTGWILYSSENERRFVDKMERDRYKERLDMRMEELHYAGRAIDMVLVTADKRPLPNQNRYLGILAQIAYYETFFDWCFFNPAGHVHCSTKKELEAATEAVCFPGSALVLSENGQVISMKELKVGDRVMSRELPGGRLLSTPVVAFLHRDENVWTPMLQVSYRPISNTSDSTVSISIHSTLYLSPNHLIYVLKRTELEEIKPVTKFAGSLVVGDVLLLSTHLKTPMQKAVVMNLTLINTWQEDLVGVYAPLTQTGNLIVNNIVVSCFANFIEEKLSYFITWPLQIYYQIRSLLNNDLSKTHVHGIHWYANGIYRIFSALLPKTLFYEPL